MKRQYPPGPIPAVAAVVFSSNKVLLVKRSNPPSKGQWSLPGGAIKLGETCVEALQREVAEESGLKIQVKDLVAVVDRIVRDQKGRVQYHYIILDYWAECLKGTAKAGSDAAEVMWVDLEVLNSAVLSQQSLEVIKKACKMREQVCFGEGRDLSQG